MAEMITEVGRWMKEKVDTNVPGLTADAINDAIEALWEGIVQAQVSKLMGGPVQLSIANATERMALVSVADPTVAPVVNNVVAGALPALAIWYATTFATESGTETNPSPTTAFNRLQNNESQVTSPGFTTGAFGYNVYAALAAAGPFFRQNTTPIDFALNWTEPSTGVVTDIELAPVAPAYNSTGDNIFYIQHMELLTPDQTYRPWNQAEIDSTLMRRAAAAVPSASPYQNYMFDLVEGGTLEIRPPLGTSLSPRYFFINKPRLLYYPNALIPMGDIGSARPFIRYFAISLLKLVNEEYQAAQQWDAKAQMKMMEIKKTIIKTTVNRNNRITPFIMS